MTLKLYSFIIAITSTVLFSCKTASKLYEKGNYTEAVEIAAKKLQKKPDDAKLLKEERVALGYKPSGTSATEMRTRLETLVSLFERRRTALNGAMAHTCSECCREHQSIICSLLEAGMTYVADKGS